VNPRSFGDGPRFRSPLMSRRTVSWVAISGTEALGHVRISKSGIDQPRQNSKTQYYISIQSPCGATGVALRPVACRCRGVPEIPSNARPWRPCGFDVSASRGSNWFWLVWKAEICCRAMQALNSLCCNVLTILEGYQMIFPPRPLTLVAREMWNQHA
jgi:hypothetical protein